MIGLALARVRYSWQVFAGLLVVMMLAVAVLYLVAAIFWEVPSAPASPQTIHEISQQVPPHSVIIRVPPQQNFPGTSANWTACDRPLPPAVIETLRQDTNATVRAPLLCTPSAPTTLNTVIASAKDGSTADQLATNIRTALAGITGLDIQTSDQLVAEQVETQRAETANQIISGVSGFGLLIPLAAIFVVGSTASFSVAARRRETAMLQLSGASAMQSATLVVIESLVISAIAGLAGCILGAILSSWFMDSILSIFVSDPPLVGLSVAGAVLAFVIGLLIAAIGSIAAAWRASRIRPIAAVRGSDTENRGIPWLRLVFSSAVGSQRGR